MSGVEHAVLAFDRSQQARERARESAFQEIKKIWQKHREEKDFSIADVMASIPRLLNAHGVGNGMERVAMLGGMLLSSSERQLRRIFESYWAR